MKAFSTGLLSALRHRPSIAIRDFRGEVQFSPGAPVENARVLASIRADSLERIAPQIGYNITVNAVAPTFIRTPETEGSLANPEFRPDVIERIAALHRIGEPMDVAGAVVFLASSAASLITGDTILLVGGWTAR